MQKLAEIFYIFAIKLEFMSRDLVSEPKRDFWANR
ncbi:MAG: hypothetical protein ACI8YQ_000755 [Polaribacter sp.]|jgi:hypothetical protein